MIRWKQIHVAVDATKAAPVDGTVAECPNCGRREWYAFRLASSKRLLLQCVQCDRIEAADGRPAPEVVSYEAAVAQADPVTHPLGWPESEVGE